MSHLPWSTLLPLSVGGPAAASAQLTLHLAADAGRSELEQFIHQCFADRHQADVQHYLPELLALRDASGRLVAAAGVRPASSGALFVERYLDMPVHLALADVQGAVVERGQWVEVGNLASVDAGSARLMIILITWLLAVRGLQWVTFTGAASLVNSFRRLGLQPSVLGVADPRRLGEEHVQWGRYYNQRPQVMVGNIGQGFAALARIGLFQRLGLPQVVEESGHAA
ncbi:thermostable hemolysin [Pseudomonas sp. RAC1]|uniref:thermostable hemolysin n=1 Tax=Pseudomonas sp. RAC1 TaxID=3064900 RepID=UPI002720B9E7|nr:thermostable hemolysin [Pseudomonas sp. RAC1]MDV9031939.1 thermostable hemolysin [Pseudomonas sp. RAC1]